MADPEQNMELKLQLLQNPDLIRSSSPETLSKIFSTNPEEYAKNMNYFNSAEFKDKVEEETHKTNIYSNELQNIGLALKRDPKNNIKEIGKQMFGTEQLRDLIRKDYVQNNIIFQGERNLSQCDFMSVEGVQKGTSQQLFEQLHQDDPFAVYFFNDIKTKDGKNLCIDINEYMANPDTLKLMLASQNISILSSQNELEQYFEDYKKLKEIMEKDPNISASDRAMIQELGRSISTEYARILTLSNTKLAKMWKSIVDYVVNINPYTLSILTSIIKSSLCFVSLCILFKTFCVEGIFAISFMVLQSLFAMKLYKFLWLICSSVSKFSLFLVRQFFEILYIICPLNFGKDVISWIISVITKLEESSHGMNLLTSLLRIMFTAYLAGQNITDYAVIIPVISSVFFSNNKQIDSMFTNFSLTFVGGSSLPMKLMFLSHYIYEALDTFVPKTDDGSWGFNLLYTIRSTENYVKFAIKSSYILENVYQVALDLMQIQNFAPSLYTNYLLKSKLSSCGWLTELFVNRNIYNYDGVNPAIRSNINPFDGSIGITDNLLLFKQGKYPRNVLNTMLQEIYHVIKPNQTISEEEFKIRVNKFVQNHNNDESYSEAVAYIQGLQTKSDASLLLKMFEKINFEEHLRKMNEFYEYFKSSGEDVYDALRNYRNTHGDLNMEYGDKEYDDWYFNYRKSEREREEKEYQEKTQKYQKERQREREERQKREENPEYDEEQRTKESQEDQEEQDQRYKAQQRNDSIYRDIGGVRLSEPIQFILPGLYTEKNLKEMRKTMNVYLHPDKVRPLNHDELVKRVNELKSTIQKNQKMTIDETYFNDLIKSNEKNQGEIAQKMLQEVNGGIQRLLDALK